VELHITGRNLEVSPEVREYLQKRLEKVFRRWPSLTQVKAELAQEATRSALDRFVAQITILTTKGSLLRGQVRAPDLFTAIDRVADVLKRQVERYKGRIVQKKARAAGIAAEEEEAPPSPILKTKRFSIKPMDPEEAVHQMELLGHDFFLFFNETTQQFNVVYRRRGGGYGLIEPELG
jgi:putative sigma-54 modulation protein